MSYVSKGFPKTIKVENSATVKIKDNYYKFGYTEEVSFEHLSVDELLEVDFEAETQVLIEKVNSVIDGQIEEIQDTYL